MPFVNAGRERKSSQKRVARAVVRVAQRPHGLAEVGQVAVLEQRVAGVRWRARRRGPAGASASPSRRSRRSTSPRCRGGSRLRASGSARRRTGRPRRRGTCGSGRPPASRGTGSRRTTSTRPRRRRAPAGSPPPRTAGRRAPAPSGGRRSGSATCRSGRCGPGSGRAPGTAAPAPRRRPAGRRPRAAAGAGRRARFPAARRSRARARRSGLPCRGPRGPRPRFFHRIVARRRYSRRMTRRVPAALALLASLGLLLAGCGGAGPGSGAPSTRRRPRRPVSRRRASGS